MRRRAPRVIVGLAAAVAVLAAAAAVYFSRGEIEFSMRFHELAHREGGYVGPAVRNELPEAVKAQESWFIERGDESVRRLRRYLTSSDRLEKLAALHLIWKVESDRGRKPDPEDFWRAFEDGPAVARLLEGPLEVLLAGGASGIHLQEEAGVLLVRFQDGGATLWRVKGKTAETNGEDSDLEKEALRSLERRTRGKTSAEAVIRKSVLAGEEAVRLRRGLARVLCLPAFTEFPLSLAPNRYCWVRCPEPGRVPAETQRQLHFTGWYWLDRLADDYAGLVAEPLAGEEARTVDRQGAVDFLLTAIESPCGPYGILHPLAGLIELDLSPEDAAGARDRLLAKPVPRGFTRSFSESAALHVLGEPAEMKNRVREWSINTAHPVHWVAAARPEGILQTFIDSYPAAIASGGIWTPIDWALVGIGMDVLEEGKLADLAGLIQSVDPLERGAFLEGAAANPRAFLHPAVLAVVRRLDPVARREYLGFEPPADKSEEGWTKLLDGLELIIPEEREMLWKKRALWREKGRAAE